MKNISAALILSTILLVLLFSGCGDRSLSISGDNLVIEVDNFLRTSVNTNEKLIYPLSSGVSSSEYLIVNHKKIGYFKQTSYNSQSLDDKIGVGKAYHFVGVYNEGGLSIEKHLTIKVYNDFPDMALFDVSYHNIGEEPVYIEKWVNNSHKVLQSNDTLLWSFQGQSSEARADWILPVTNGFYQQNYLGMNNTDYGGGIPVTDLWRKDIGVAIGHTSLNPELVSIPVKMDNLSYAETWIEKSFDKENYELQTGDTLTLPETFVLIHHGDAFNTLKRFALLMGKKGIHFNKSPETAYESVWCAWGYRRKFTAAEVIGTLPKVKELGIKWAVIDDGYQIGEGDWNVDTKRFSEGNSMMINLVKKIHENGLKAKLWWAPLALDPCTPLWNEHYHDILLLNEDTSPRFITWWDAYYMSPVADITINETKKTLDMFFDEWDFDGLKMDGQHMNAVPPDYNELHYINTPEEAPQMLPDFFRMVYKTSLSKKKDAVIENCPCGCCISFYNLAGMNQAVSSDPLDSWQIRLKGKVYHALNPDLAYYGDHVELSDNGDDFASSFGVGAVLGTKFTWPADSPFSDRSSLLTAEKEVKWKKWFGLYNKLMLSKGEYLGNLYDIGFDRPEAHVIKKDNRLYYAFYADNWDGFITLKGLDKTKSYIVSDYVNSKKIATLAAGINNFKTSFKSSLLVVVTEEK